MGIDQEYPVIRILGEVTSLHQRVMLQTFSPLADLFVRRASRGRHQME